MELKNVFIDAEKSLGNITFAGAGRESQQRINGGRHAVISRTYRSEEHTSELQSR